jgi:hypothetical protein
MSKTNQATAPAVNDIEWGIVEGENTEFAVQYPRMQWVHGEAKASGFMKSGGLFISSEQYPNFEAEGFESSTLITEDGTEIPGSAAVSTTLAVIRVKHQWIHNNEDNRNVKLVQALCVAKGNDDLLCFSLKGATKAIRFQNAFNQHMLQNVSVANRTRPSGAPHLEPFALWFPVRAAAPEKVTAKDSDKSSVVTPPELIVPDKIDRDYVVSLWVGAQNYKQFAGYFKETAAWQKTPIWEQRNGIAEEETAAEFTGADLATDAQLQHFINICTAKGFNEREITLEATKGVTDRFEELSRADARMLIDGLAKL